MAVKWRAGECMRPGHQFLTNIANLFKVKTIITLVVVFTFCFLTVKGIQLSNEFVMIATAVITYYFTKQDEKKETEDHYYFDERRRDDRYE